MRQMYSMIVHDDPDGLWGEFPDFPGCFTAGDSLQELFENSGDAIACELEDEQEEPCFGIVVDGNIVYQTAMNG